MYDSTFDAVNAPANPDTLDFLNWVCNESPTSRPMDDAELERHYRERLADDARCEAAAVAVAPAPRYIVRVDVRGKRFAAAVECPGGRTVKAGTFAREADAHRAADALAARLRGEAAAVA